MGIPGTEMYSSAMAPPIGKFGLRLTLVGVGLVALGIVFGALRVRGLEKNDVNARSTPQPVESAREGLVEARLTQGQDVIFEVCADDAFDGRHWERREFLVRYVDTEPPEVAQRALFEADLRPRVRRHETASHGTATAPSHGCLNVASGQALPVGGRYALAIVTTDESDPAAELNDEAPERDATQGHAEENPLVTGRIIAVTAIGSLDRVAVYLVLLGTLLLLTAGVVRRAPTPSPTQPADNGRELRNVAIGTLLFAATIVGLGLLPLHGALLGMLRGLLIAIFEIALAVWLVSKPRATTLAWWRPRLPIAYLVATPFLIGGLWTAGRLLIALVPATGRAPIEAFVSFPSGSLAYAVIATFLPVAEELFFRGFVYGNLERRLNVNAATLLTVAVFALAHLPQQFGAWGPFVSVTATGFVLTLLRRFSGSTVLPALVHVGHNAVITLLAVH